MVAKRLIKKNFILILFTEPSVNRLTLVHFFMAFHFFLFDFQLNKLHINTVYNVLCVSEGKNTHIGYQVFLIKRIHRFDFT